MRHCDAETLALRALGERAGSPADDAHLADCRTCRDELESLRGVTAVGRSIRPEDAVVDPPPHVWQSVAATLGLHPSVRPASVGPQRASGTSGGTWSRRLATTALGAAAGLVLGVAGTLLLTGGPDEPGPAGATVAQAELRPLADYSATGVATVRDTAEGRSLSVDLRGLGESDGYYEVWLLDAEAQRLVSLGVLDGSRAELALPRDLDLAEFPVVDVSVEAFDGNPGHSADSVVRGQLSS